MLEQRAVDAPTRLDIDSRQRFASPTTQWHEGGMLSRFVGAFNYDVQRRTGWATSLVPAGKWYRGLLFRGQSVRLVPPPEMIMYDPTDPLTWDSPRVQGRKSKGR